MRAARRTYLTAPPAIRLLLRSARAAQQAWGGQAPLPASLNAPYSVAVLPTGQLAIVDNVENAILLARFLIQAGL